MLKLTDSINDKPLIKASTLLHELFDIYKTKLSNVMMLAQKTKTLIDKIDPFIQNYTSIVCPNCKDVCCINRHGRYDFEDLLYIHALQVEEPIFLEKVDEKDPCQFLSSKGCTIERFRRPFRCNWYFCDSLLQAMMNENGPVRPYRAFINLLNEIVQTRREMIDEFFWCLGKEMQKFL